MPPLPVAAAMSFLSYQVWVLGTVALLRLWELVFSHRKLVQARRASGAELIAEPEYPLMVLVHGGWFAGMIAETVVRNFPFSGVIVLAALLLWIIALALRFWVLISLDDFWNVRLIARPNQPVIVSGPYRYLRHPNYLAVILEIAAVPLIVGAPFTALLASIANGLVLIQRIRREEAYLFTVPGYAQAFRGKKRLIPWVF